MGKLSSAAYLAKHLNVDHNQILFGNGSNELIVFLAHLS